jgi:hypothetical protein
MDTVKEIRDIAKRCEWIEIDHQENISMISFTKSRSRINVYYSKPWRMTVATVVNHPTVGRQQLFRKYVRMDELERIFRYPRTHTGKGYYST